MCTYQLVFKVITFIFQLCTFNRSLRECEYRKMVENVFKRQLIRTCILKIVWKFQNRGFTVFVVNEIFIFVSEYVEAGARVKTLHILRVILHEFRLQQTRSLPPHELCCWRIWLTARALFGKFPRNLKFSTQTNRKRIVGGTSTLATDGRPPPPPAQYSLQLLLLLLYFCPTVIRPLGKTKRENFRGRHRLIDDSSAASLVSDQPINHPRSSGRTDTVWRLIFRQTFQNEAYQMMWFFENNRVYILITHDKLYDE